MNLHTPHWTKYSHNPLSPHERDLILETRQAVETERNSTVRLIELFEKLDQGKTYLKLGFSSLYEFAVKDLHMSEGAPPRYEQKPATVSSPARVFKNSNYN